MNNQDSKKKVTKQEFQANLFSYIGVMIMLVYINLTYSPEHLWFIYPMIGWGLGLFGQYQAWKQTEKEQKPLYREEDLV